MKEVYDKFDQLRENKNLEKSQIFGLKDLKLRELRKVSEKGDLAKKQKEKKASSPKLKPSLNKTAEYSKTFKKVETWHWNDNSMNMSIKGLKDVKPRIDS